MTISHLIIISKQTLQNKKKSTNHKHIEYDLIIFENSTVQKVLIYLMSSCP